MYQVVGIERKEGKYEGREYDNTYLHCGFHKEGCEGTAVETIKTKTANIHEPIKIGDTVGVHYDRYGRVEAVYKT